MHNENLCAPREFKLRTLTFKSCTAGAHLHYAFCIMHYAFAFKSLFTYFCPDGQNGNKLLHKIVFLSWLEVFCKSALFRDYFYGSINLV